MFFLKQLICMEKQNKTNKKLAKLLKPNQIGYKQLN